MSDDIKYLKAECNSQFSIERKGNEITLSIKLSGLPDVVLDRITDIGESLATPLTMAIFQNLGAVAVDKDTVDKIDEAMSTQSRTRLH